MSRRHAEAVLRSVVATLLANGRYWRTIWPDVLNELRHWHERALAIPDLRLRAIAIEKLRAERFNSEVAATIAATAPAGRRDAVTKAIVALQVAYDYLDLLTELPMRDADRSRTMAALVQGFRAAHDEQRAELDVGEDGSYLAALLRTVKRSLDSLPAAGVVRATALERAVLCAQAQASRHAGAHVDPTEPRADDETIALAAASGSVLCLHALIAAASSPTTTVEEARRIDALYLQISALTTLDSLVDDDTDRASVGSARSDPEALADRLAAIAQDAHERARHVPHTAHHRLTIAGVIAYYGSDAGAGNDRAIATIAQLRAELAPELAPVFWTMRTWRAAKRRRLVSSGLSGRALYVTDPRVSVAGGARPAGVDLLTPLETRRWWRE